MPESLKFKVLQSSCKQARYGHPKIPHTFPMVGNTCTDKLCTAATVHFLWAKWFVHTCHYKGFTCSSYKGSGERK